MAVSFLKGSVQDVAPTVSAASAPAHLLQMSRGTTTPACDAHGRPPYPHEAPGALAVDSLNRACRLRDNSADPHCHTGQAHASCPCRPTPSQYLMAGSSTQQHAAAMPQDGAPQPQDRQLHHGAPQLQYGP
eukprot:249476-Prorocentrum_lima.AAC.1